MLGLGMPEIVVICVVLLLVFGPSKLPQLGKGVGEAIAGFRKSVHTKDNGVPN